MSYVPKTLIFVPDTPDAGPLVWTDPASARHAVRVVCDLMGLTAQMKDILCACVEVESNFNPLAVHYNRDTEGNILSIDYGIAQINSYWNIGTDKPFPSSEYVLQNPQICIQFMCDMFLQGHENLWCSYTSGLYNKYL